MNELYLNLIKTLNPLYGLKFDGSILYVTPKKGKKFVVDVTIDEVQEADGCSKTAALKKLAQQTGLHVEGSTVSTPKKLVPVAISKEVLHSVGVSLDHIAPENYKEHSAQVYKPGRKVDVGYASIKMDGATLLFTFDPGDDLNIVLNNYLLELPEGLFKNQAVNKYVKMLKSLSVEKRTAKLISTTTIQDLGVPIVNRILVLS